MTEYEMKIKEAANDVKYMRTVNGAMYSQMIFSLIAIMLANKKITKDDLEIILEVERVAIKDSVKSYAESNYGQENSAITGTEDVKEIEKLCLEYVDEIRKMITEVADQIAPPKKRRKKKATKTLDAKSLNGIAGIIPKAEVELMIPPKVELEKPTSPPVRVIKENECEPKKKVEKEKIK